MLEVNLLKTLIREIFSRQKTERIPEPTLVMGDPEQVKSYRSAGLENAVMAPVYLFHCAQVCDVIKPGDIVLDLACGPANQLGQIARINPEVQFKGIDLSQEMLLQAASLIKEKNLTNIELVHGSISELSMFEENSIDAVYSTMAIHHLSDSDSLNKMFQEINRVLKPGGGVYLVDFGRLKCEKSIKYFANQYADRQPELFTLDYLNSLRAAFTVRDFRENSEPIRGRAAIYQTFLVPYMIAFKSHNRGDFDKKILSEISQMRTKLPEHHKEDFSNLINFFKHGGLKSSSLL